MLSVPVFAEYTDICLLYKIISGNISVDHSRVKLIPFDDDEGSDFINASYIPVK